MTGTVRFHLLPADDGDCIFVEALAEDGSVTTMLIDGGRGHTYSNWGPLLSKLLGRRRKIDLLVVTHIDADHIGGILSMLEHSDRDFDIGRIWFNGRAQVEAALNPDAGREEFGVAQADELSRAIVSAALSWNTETDGGPIHSELGEPAFDVGHFRMTVLTPTRAKLGSMASVWAKATSEALAEETQTPKGLEGLGTSPIDVAVLLSVADENDNSRPNGSSMSFLVEAFGRVLLLAGDAHPNDLAKAVAVRRNTDGLPLKVDIFKLSHHGARKNTTRELLGHVTADVYAISTNGRHGHPDGSTLAKVVRSNERSKILAFNYRTSATDSWNAEGLQSSENFLALFPDDGADGHLFVELPLVDG